MKKFGFFSFMFALVVITLSSSTCRKPIDEEEVILDTTTNNTGGGNLIGLPVRADVHVNSPAGLPAGGATVKLAYTLDSAVNEKYFTQKLTNDSGYVIFNDLKVDATTKTKKYFANAYFSQGGDDLNSMNGGLSNGPVGFTEKQNGTPVSIAIVVTSK